MSHEGGLVSINVSPNGKLLVFASKSGHIQVCDADNGAPIRAIETDTKLKSTSISPDSQSIVSFSYSRNHGVRIWNVNDGRLLGILPHDIISVSFSPDSNQLASAYEDGLIQVWGTSATQPTLEWRTGPQPVCVFFSPNGRQLATPTGDNVYILRRDANGVVALNGHTSPVTSSAFSADGLTLASGSLDGTIRVWDASSTGSNTVENGKQEGWYRVHWSPRSRFVMALGRELNVWIWSTQDGT
ncbi:WD40-repeat-containing domain protein, partial [Lactarius vividus]